MLFDPFSHPRMLSQIFPEVYYFSVTWQLAEYLLAYLNCYIAGGKAVAQFKLNVNRIAVSSAYIM